MPTETQQRYVASNKCMKKGYWKIIDNIDGSTVESGFRSKKHADEYAREYDPRSKTSWR